MSVNSVQDLRKTYGPTVAVEGASFTVEEGEIFGILGPNGAGKTTTVECAVGPREPDAGTITGLSLDPQSRRAAQRGWWWEWPPSDSSGGSESRV
jgi:ABC-2 type transport system ATP-binding protein